MRRLWKHRDDLLNDEIEFYLNQQANEFEASGMSAREARLAARRKLGNVGLVREDTRAARGWLWLERLWQDVSHGARMFGKNPGFTLVAVMSIALGAGANCAMFSAADALLWRPLPVRDPGEIYSVGTRLDLEAFGDFTMSYRDYADLRQQIPGFRNFAAYSNLRTAFVAHPSPDANTRVRTGMLVTGNFFEVMGIRPQLGRAIQPRDDEVPSRDAVVVLSHSLWESEFASNPQVIDRQVLINGVSFTVIGIAPPEFSQMGAMLRQEFFIPAMMWPAVNAYPRQHQLEERTARYMYVKGRFAPGSSIAKLSADVLSFGQHLAHEYPGSNRDVNYEVHTEFATRMIELPGIAKMSFMIMVLAVAVLLVACANLAGMLLSRAPLRAREIALRLALGAPRARLIRQLATENLMLAVVGACLGVAFGGTVIRVLQAYQFPTELTTSLQFRLDSRALGYCLAAAIGSVLIFGLAPSLQTLRVNASSGTKGYGTASHSGTGLWGRNLLVAAQVAITLVLVTVSVALYGGVKREFLNGGPGYRTDHLLVMSFDPGLAHYADVKARGFYDDLLERTHGLRGVKAAALAEGVPMSMTGSSEVTRIIPEGHETVRSGAASGGHLQLTTRVDENFLGTLGIHVIEGRGFLETDNETGPQVAVVNRTLASHYWPGLDPLGKRFRIGTEDSPPVEIVGVTPTSKYVWPGEGPTGFIYLPLQQHRTLRMTLIVESLGDPSALARPLRELAKSVDPHVPVFDVMTMDHLYTARVVAAGNMSVQIVGGMGVIGMILSMIGLYGLVSYHVSARTREIGIRMAVGAGGPSVMRMILGQGLVLCLIGVLIGLVGSYGALRVSKSVLTLLDAAGPREYSLTAVAVFATILFAAFVPAKRASHLDPVTALREE